MTTAAMTPGERVRAALKGEAVDRVPFCFWHHFKPEGSGERMAELTMEFFRTKFDLDIVKIMPDLLYPAPEPAITQAAQWSSLPRLGLDNARRQVPHFGVFCVLKLNLCHVYGTLMMRNHPSNEIAVGPNC